MKTKKLLAFILSMVLVIGLAACSDGGNNQGGDSENKTVREERLVFDDVNKPLGEGELANVLPDEFFQGNMTVNSVTIERRQTNDKEDIVYIVVEMENNHVHRTAYYKLTINFYDVGGWMIDEWESYQTATFFPTAPPSDDIVNNTLNWRYVNEGYTVTLISANNDNLRDGHTVHTFDVNLDKTYASSSGSVTVVSDFSENSGSWSSSIASENVVTDWKFDKMIGSYAVSWHNGHLNNYELTVNITDVTNNSLSANGSLLNIPVTDRMVGYYFDEVFNCENKNDKFSFTISGNPDAWDNAFSRVSCEVVFGFNNVEIRTSVWGSWEWRTQSFTMSRIS
jgi:hypothetical protein